MEKIKQIVQVGWPVIVIGLFILAGVYFQSPDAMPTVAPTFTPTATPPVVTDPTLLRATAQAIESTIETNVTDAESHYRLGLVLTVLDTEQAVEHLEQAAALDRDYEGPTTRLLGTLRLVEFTDDEAYKLTLIGQGLAAIQEWRLAQTAFYFATEENPEYAEAWAYLGEAQQRNGEDGFKALQTAFTLDPNSFSVNIFMGTYWRRQGRPELAIDYLETALEMDPSNVLVLEDLGNALGEAGRIEEALDKFQIIIDDHKYEASSWIALANFCLDNEVKVETVGISAAREVVVLEPESPIGYTLIGRFYSLQGDVENAEKFFERAIELNASYSPAYFHLGLLYINSGQPEKARPHLEKTLSLSNDPAVRQDTLDLLAKLDT